MATETVKITSLKLQIGTDRTVVADWSWSKDKTDHYEVKWKYLRRSNETDDGAWYDANDGNITSTTRKQHMYTASGVDVAVRVMIRAVATTTETNGKTESAWPTTEWATKDYLFEDNPPEKPSAPTVSLSTYQLTAEYDNIDINATGIQFQVIRDNQTSSYKEQKCTIITNHVSCTWTVEAGSVYKVRARGYKGSTYGEWSDYSSNVNAAPTVPNIIKINVRSKTQIDITWAKINSADTYKVQYAKKIDNLSAEEHFTDPGVDKKEFTVDIDELTDVDGYVTLTISNIDTGFYYYIRMCSGSSSTSSSSSTSNWSDIKSFIIGTEPTSPTTWSSTTTAIVGESLKLNWIHNSEDGSTMTSSQLNLYVNGELSEGSPYTITQDAFEDPLGIISLDKFDDEKETVRVCTVNTNAFAEGSTIEWNVRTEGVLEGTYGEYSILRKIDIYAPPVVSLSIKDLNGNAFETLTTFPFSVVGTAGNAVNQKPIGYYINIVSNESYDTIDNVGNDITVTEGSNVYSNYFGIDNIKYDKVSVVDNSITVQLSASDVTLLNNISYTIHITVSMDSGLTASDSREFNVLWTDEVVSPFANITINKDDLSAYIMPYAKNDDDILLSVYRKEFDGSFTEIATDIQDGSNTYVTDPHPPLDYARYRIVAKTKTTGTVSYSDMPAYSVNEKNIVIQWDEKWSSFEALSGDRMSEQPWNGSMIKIPYNIDVSDNYSPDVSLVEYIGRKRPVSYYGTQIRESSTWSVEIPKSDKEMLYAIRRLATWMGDVYVREPSGSGYWAQVKVSFSQKHCDVVIPVSFAINRVEGGM